MAATTGIWNQSMPAVNALADTNPKSNASANSGSSTVAASSISSNDFLTLLVTEMKNQDPTANNDPNQYVNQLVQVNSLEQLIDINQNLKEALGTTTTPPATGKSAKAENVASTVADATTRTARQDANSAGASPSAMAGANSVPHFRNGLASGNLSVPNASPAAHRVAQALGGRL